MIEYFTEAIVLGKKEIGDFDGLIFLYTKDLGMVAAKAQGIRKITSKLAGHLEPLNFVRARLIEKNGFRIADALATKQRKQTRASIENFSKLLNLLQFIKETAFELQPDPYFWREIRKVLISDFDEKITYRNLLKILGFDTKFASCHNCGSKAVDCFYKTDQIFFCKKCSGKIPQNEVILI